MRRRRLQSKPRPPLGRIDVSDREETPAVPPFHSITLSVRASSAGGTVSPSALTVLRLITNLNLVAGSSTKRVTGKP